MQPIFDSGGLEAFFTNVEQLRNLFSKMATASTLTRRLLIIHGVGGIGKSSLLRMFRLYCKKKGVVVGLASGDETDSKSVIGILFNWAEDLKGSKLVLPTFAKTLKHYQLIQAKVDEQVNKAKTIGNKTVEAFEKVAGKTVEAALGTVIGAALGSVIPGIGTFAGALSGIGAEALVDWLRGFLAMPEIDLLRDPNEKLTEDFLADISRLASKQRIVLMLDTYEQISSLNDWMCGFAQRLHPNVILVIAGRTIPNWNRDWPTWLAQAEVHELKPMTESAMHELVRRYYATIHGGEPELKQVEAIIRFARGLPVVVTSAVQLWVQYGVEDFQAVKSQVVADLVDRLTQGVPSGIRIMLDAAASLRWFNKEILRATTRQTDVSTAFNELRRFPFTHPRTYGFALHDAVREILDENLRIQDPELHRELHERAATYFLEQISKHTGEEAVQFGLEWLYHVVVIDEATGVKLFQATAEGLARNGLVDRLRVLVNDANTYKLEQINSRLWRKYYDARLAHLEGHFGQAEQAYEYILAAEKSDTKLQAYVLCDLGRILVRLEKLTEPGGFEKAQSILDRSQTPAFEKDTKLILGYTNQWTFNIVQGKSEIALYFLIRQLDLFQSMNNVEGIIYTLGTLKEHYGLTGDWRKGFESYMRGRDELEKIPDHPSLKARILGDGPWCLIWSGRFGEAEQGIRYSVELTRQTGDTNILPLRLRFLALVLGLSGKYEEALQCTAEAIKIRQESRSTRWNTGGIAQGYRGLTLLKQGKLDLAEDSLNESLRRKHEIQDNIGIPEILNWLGELQEIKAKQLDAPSALSQAESYYRQSIEMSWTGLRYFECGALTGLVRVKHRQQDLSMISSLMTKADAIAQEYEYNDHLASLRLTQAHLAWKNDFRAARRFCQYALIFALRYNRFLLDELLSGQVQDTALVSIIPYYLKKGDEGRRLLAELREWWRTGVNDIGTSRAASISPIAEGISLQEAERIAREREPGHRSHQKTVLEQFTSVLG